MAEVNVTAFGTIFKAVGAKLNYNSERVQLEVIETPKSKDKIIEAAISDIAKFESTANYTDGAAALAIADVIDGIKNPIPEKVRQAILYGLDITKDSKYIYQVMSLALNNRSWHISPIPNKCVFFGDACVCRGINPDPNRKGRRSFRKPEEYHRLDTVRTIVGVREQLVTEPVRRLFKSIPQEKFISGAHGMSINLNLKALSKMSVEDKIKAITTLQESIE